MNSFFTPDGQSSPADSRCVLLVLLDLGTKRLLPLLAVNVLGGFIQLFQASVDRTPS